MILLRSKKSVSISRFFKILDAKETQIDLLIIKSIFKRKINFQKQLCFARFSKRFAI